VEGEGVDDTSEALAMRHLTFLMGESSLGDLKSDVGGVEEVAIAATSLVAVSYSSLSLPDEYSSCVKNTNFGCFFLDEPFFTNGFFGGILDLFLRMSFPPWYSLFS
jgi:hypothetical protein